MHTLQTSTIASTGIRRLLLPWLFLMVFSAAAVAGPRFIANQGNKLCIFDTDGQLEWSMELQGSPHDMHWLPDDRLLTHQGTEIVEIDIKKKEITWSFDAKKLSNKPRVEVHAIQPLKNGSVMISLSGERKIFEINRAGEVQHSIDMVVNNPHPHRDTRLVRKLENGNYLVAHEGDGTIREYDTHGQIVWEFSVPLFDKQPKNGHGPEGFGNSAFSAIRLKNGNTLIGTGNGHGILEVDHDKKIVWRLKQNDLEGITLAWVTTLEVHPNGHIVFGNCHAGPDNPQIIELDREKKVHWSFKDFTNLGNNVSNSQILGVEGVIR